MPTFFKRSNGMFYAIVEDGDGKRRWLSTGQRKKGLALSTVLSSIDVPEPIAPKISLGEFRREFFSYARKVFSSATVGVYERSFRHFLDLTGDISLKSITLRHVDRFKASRLQEIKPVTVNVELRYFPFR